MTDYDFEKLNHNQRSLRGDSLNKMTLQKKMRSFHLQGMQAITLVPLRVILMYQTGKETALKMSLSVILAIITVIAEKPLDNKI
jgi:hypothetical protein